MRAEAPAETRIEVIMFSGDTVAFGPFELVRSYFHRYMIIQYILLCFFVTVIDTRNGFGQMFLDERARNIALSIALGVLLLAIFALVLEYIGYRNGTVRIKGSPFLLTAAVIGVLVDVTVSNEAVLPVPGLIMLLIYYYVVVEAFAHLLVLFVMPRVLGDLRRRKAGAAPKAADPVGPSQVAQDADHVEIGDKRIRADTLIRVMAEGNYLRVVTKDERLYLPGPFGAVVDPLPERLGVRVSRSDWVAAKAARAIRRDGREMFVDLQDGTAVRVANSRQKVVTSVLDLPIERSRMDPSQGAGAAEDRDRSIHSG